MKTLKEISRPGATGVMPPKTDVDVDVKIPKEYLRQDLWLPQVAEHEVIRHYTSLANRNFGVDTGFYPLGSCTMKYNPKVCEDIARFEGFADVHPLQDADDIQGCLQIMHELEKDLCALCGMDGFTLQPAAGAHGELCGIMIFEKYFKDRGEKRKKIIVPDSSHGTNPATASFCGFEVIVLNSDDEGNVDVNDLKQKMNSDVAGLMLTNPNTLGLFDKQICEITKIVHDGGGLVYYDGANMNAIMGYARPGDMGFDIVHLNLHKTFATPHGGGGPGSGPVGVKGKLKEYLPMPHVKFDGKKYSLDFSKGMSIGFMRAFWGSFGVIVRAYSYIRALGGAGLKDASRHAVLNANYLMKQLENDFFIPYKRFCMHEFVMSSRDIAAEYGVHTLDIAKRLLDLGFHAPTIYFPLIVEEAMMIEPTETESKDTLDDFAKALKQIVNECKTDKQKVLQAPASTVVSRLDDTLASRKPVLNWKMKRE